MDAVDVDVWDGEKGIVTPADGKTLIAGVSVGPIGS